MLNFGHMTKDLFTNEQKNEANSTGSRYSLVDGFVDGFAVSAKLTSSNSEKSAE
jgi:hypothetical protein